MSLVTAGLLAATALLALGLLAALKARGTALRALAEAGRRLEQHTAEQHTAEQPAEREVSRGALSVEKEPLRQSEERLSSLFNNATDLIQSVGLDGRFHYVNRAWLETLGYSEHEAYQLRLEDVVAPEQLTACRQAFERIRRGETLRGLETIFLTRRGSPIVVEGNVSCFLRDGEPAAMRGIFRDITKRKEVEQLKTDFISMVSHELRTPLTSIHASLKLLSAGSEDEVPERLRQLIEIADRNTQRLVRLVEDIIDVERIESGNLRFRLELVDLVALIAQAVDGCRSLAAGLGIELAGPDDADEATVLADPDRVQQVLANLLSNALKHSPANGVVRVSVSRGPGRVRIAVSDQGPGIAEALREKVFERFVQAGPPETRAVEGTGLGLAIAKSIVERLGGEIAVEPNPRGGSVFFFDLPEHGEVARRAPTPAARSARILRRPG